MKMMTEKQEDILNKLTELAQGDTALVAQALYEEDRSFGDVIKYIQDHTGKKNTDGGTAPI